MVSTLVEVNRPVATFRTNLVTALLSTWFTVGLFLDVWAHNNVPELETFFTPWHAVFYSGFAATAAWIGWTARGALRPDRPRVEGIPTGYGAAVVAVAGFALAGAGDLAWHTVFGIEQRIDILFSPTHLGLAASMFAIITTPLRAAWADRTLPSAPGLRRLLPAILATALASTLVLLLFQYANALAFGSGDVAVAMSTVEEGFTAHVVSSMAVTNLVLLAPILALARRWVLPFGTATIIYTALGGLSLAITGFDNVDLILGVVLGAVCVDLLAGWLRPSPRRPWQFRAFAAGVPLITWTAYVVTGLLTSPPVLDGAGGRPGLLVEVATGAPIVQALIGLLLGILLVPDNRWAPTPFVDKEHVGAE
jgi:hypothetical protein